MCALLVLTTLEWANEHKLKTRFRLPTWNISFTALKLTTLMPFLDKLFSQTIYCSGRTTSFSTKVLKIPQYNVPMYIHTWIQYGLGNTHRWNFICKMFLGRALNCHNLQETSENCSFGTIGSMAWNILLTVVNRSMVMVRLWWCWTWRSNVLKTKKPKTLLSGLTWSEIASTIIFIKVNSKWNPK